MSDPVSADLDTGDQPEVFARKIDAKSPLNPHCEAMAPLSGGGSVMGVWLPNGTLLQ